MNYKQALIIELDSYLTDLAKYEFKGKKEYHHLISRSNILYRYDFRNLYAVDRESHGFITDKSGFKRYFLDTLPISTQLWIEEHQQDNIKDYLLKNCLTEIEFLEQKKEELLARMPNSFDLYNRNRELNGLATFSTKLIEQRELDRLNSFIIEREIKLRELKPKRRKLTLAREYKHTSYLKMKEYKHNLVVQRQQQELQTN